MDFFGGQSSYILSTTAGIKTRNFPGRYFPFKRLIKLNYFCVISKKYLQAYHDIFE